MLSFRVGEVDDLKGLILRVAEVIDSFNSAKSTRDRNMKEPLLKPVVFSLSLTAVGVEDDRVPKDAFVMKYKPTDN
jgi:hypothetical protein